MDFLSLPERTKGERFYGLTSVADFGISTGALQQILEDFHSYIDIAKLGIGSAAVTPNLQEKIQIYKKYGVKPYCGGTLFEKCFLQGKITEYASYLKEVGIKWIEVSNGTLDIPLTERLALVEELQKDFHVIGEVGSKDSSIEMGVSEWTHEIEVLLEAGCQYVITEGRDSGTAGIYRKDGQIKSDLIMDVMRNIDVNKVIFEAANPKHQMYFINQFGPNVNLGNVRLQDVLLLEAQRQGLRSETFFMNRKLSKPL